MFGNEVPINLIRLNKMSSDCVKQYEVTLGAGVANAGWQPSPFPSAVDPAQ